jgi:pre-mRNA cleavage complex 2 protein Pcf11
MSYGGASDEVAEDFKLALEDLTMTTRYEISNLTIIAKENTEHALAISEVLKDHIKKVSHCLLYSHMWISEPICPEKTGLYDFQIPIFRALLTIV